MDHANGVIIDDRLYITRRFQLTVSCSSAILDGLRDAQTQIPLDFSVRNTPDNNHAVIDVTYAGPHDDNIVLEEIERVVYQFVPVHDMIEWD
jgi:hypothetical protein